MTAAATTNRTGTAGAAGRRWGWDSQWLMIGAALVVVALLALVPLFFLVGESFSSANGDARAVARFTLEHYAAAYGDKESFRLLLNSVVYALGTAVFAFSVGGVLAWLNERADLPLKALSYALAVVPLVIPGVLFTVSWILLGSPKIGILNKLLQGLFNTDYVFFDIYSLWGMIWVEGLQYSPVAFLLMSATFRAMDPSLEESALMSGASLLQVARRVTFPLAMPAMAGAFLILFIRALESFEVPALLGLPVGIQVFTSAIYEALHQYPSRVGQASAYAAVLLAIAAAGIWFQSHVTARGKRFATVTGKGFRPRPMPLGPWRWVAATGVVLYFLLIVVLPFLVLAWASSQRFYSVPSWEGVRDMSWAAYQSLLARPDLAVAVRNSLLLAVSCATLVTLFTAVLAWVIHKSRAPGRAVLEQLITLPLVYPGLVLGLAIMVFYLHYGQFIYGTIWILLIAYMTRFMPYGLRYNTASMLQIHKDLEESAQMSGASWGAIFRRVVLPLLKPGLMAGWLFVLIVSLRELSSSILLYGPDSVVVPVVIWELLAAGQFVELAALGVLLMLALLVLVLVAQWLGKRFGVKEM